MLTLTGLFSSGVTNNTDDIEPAGNNTGMLQQKQLNGIQPVSEPLKSFKRKSASSGSN